LLGLDGQVWCCSESAWFQQYHRRLQCISFEADGCRNRCSLNKCRFEEKRPTCLRVLVRLSCRILVTLSLPPVCFFICALTCPLLSPPSTFVGVCTLTGWNELLAAGGGRSILIGRMMRRTSTWRTPCCMTGTTSQGLLHRQSRSSKRGSWPGKKQPPWLLRICDDMLGWSGLILHQGRI